MARYLTVTETAVLVRQALAKNFPGVKFSVRSSTYSGGASIDVRWVLGPTTKEVDAITGQYESASFDGMIDMEISYTHWLLPDGTTQVESTPGSEGSKGVIPEVPHQPRPEGAEMVHFGAHYVQCQRRLTDNCEDEMKLREQVAKDMCALQHVEWNGPYSTIHLFGEGDTEQVDQHAWRLLNETSFKPGEVYDGVRYATEEERASPGWDTWTVFVIIKEGPTVAVKYDPSDPIANTIRNGITVRENKEHHGIEMVFPSKPPAATISRMKANGWRWNHKSGLWYNRMTEENKQFAESLMRSKEAK